MFIVIVNHDYIPVYLRWNRNQGMVEQLKFGSRRRS